MVKYALCAIVSRLEKKAKQNCEESFEAKDGLTCMRHGFDSLILLSLNQIGAICMIFN